MSFTLVRSSFTPDLSLRDGDRSDEFGSEFSTFFCKYANGEVDLFVYDGKLWALVFNRASLEIVFHEETVMRFNEALKNIQCVEWKQEYDTPYGHGDL